MTQSLLINHPAACTAAALHGIHCTDVHVQEVLHMTIQVRQLHPMHVEVMVVNVSEAVDLHVSWELHCIGQGYHKGGETEMAHL